ncbi:MAG: type II toxin-antitoxin system HicB family antitoxin [Candidatus Methanoperedens sp.]|jgi:predicted RNase H-like HicB family nuclease|nr:type II toxin-antitoxin system HicB family antitoxin [Candidatus Methanoperedens sp.]PKL52787.1 MAG: type II toxin-antitoxin system HicB family antitoxin [Candidatus Methanoperedenaceae archaeon HGW-Methanoperedenaceae-1]
MEKYTLPVVIEKDDCGYFAMCPALQGCYSQGDTYEEAIENIKDAIRLHIEDIIESGEVVEKINSFSLVALEVTA